VETEIIVKCPLELLDSAIEYAERSREIMTSDYTRRENWHFPSWSPDGGSLAFFCGENICMLSFEEKTFQRVPSVRGRNLAWSPDGGYLAYIYSGDIYIFDLDTRSVTNFTETSDYREAQFFWIDYGIAQQLVANIRQSQ
jgi:hypothetical protein